MDNKRKKIIAPIIISNGLKSRPLSPYTFVSPILSRIRSETDTSKISASLISVVVSG